ncbi:hypothetical protein GQ53DRAFT_817578 [Thozetella sp. PMI_491]|nr:hypothetical protein GQ53DRAFT_817578 [Thozetella sp. PMI_491]
MLTIKRASKNRPVDETTSPTDEDVGESVTSSPKSVFGPVCKQEEMRRSPSIETPRRLSKSAEPPSVPVSIDIPLGNQATSFFLASHVMIPTDQTQRGSYTFVHKIITEETMDDCFAPAFQAASLATLSTQPSYRKVRALAQSYYIKAVGALRSAVADRKRASKSQTLAATLLLSLYEILACPTKKLDVYEAHARGAMELVRIRGPSQLETPEGLEMVIMARSRFLMLESLPGASIDMVLDSIPFAKACYGDRMGTLGFMINTQLHLRKEIQMLFDGRCGQMSASVMREKVASLFEQTMEGAKRFQLLSTQCPPAFCPIPINASDDFPGSKMYTFENHWNATFHVTCQGACLMLLNHVFRCLVFLCNYTNYDTTVEYETAQEMARSAVQSLVAMVNYSTRAFRPVAPSQKLSSPPPMRAIAVMSVFCSGIASEFANDDQRKYIRSRLRSMADEGGIAQAEALLGVGDCRLPADDIERDKKRWMSRYG